MSDIDQKLQFMAREDEEKHTEDQAKKLGLPYINLVGYPFSPDVLAIVPEDQSLAKGVISYLKVGSTVKVATHLPNDPEVKKYLEELKNATRAEIVLNFCSESSFRYGLQMHQVLVPQKGAATGVEVTEQKESAFEKEIQNIEDLRDKITKVSTTDLLDLIFAGAIKLDASDIHIEPGEANFRIRYRLDGVLETIAELPMKAFHNLMNRIKFLAKLKYDVTHPQDGRMTVNVVGTEVDIRVATLPTSYGEAAGMRLLPKNKQFQKLENLGFNAEALKLIKDAISKPQGIILNTGPTGSGKTTTLYAILQELNKPGKKIITLEDPIEYRVPGIEQVQITASEKVRSEKRESGTKEAQNDESAATTFLDALKGCMRQDPDILMVGEIRDGETAKIALQAAMTGHLVLSTVHTNNAPAALARLADLGVEPYLLAGSINVIIGQRLVRKIHTECGGKGCPICRQTGFKGRIAIVEVLKPSPEIEQLIHDKAPLRVFEETAHKLGMRTMYEDGMDKVKQGLTTKEEIERVISE